MNKQILLLFFMSLCLHTNTMTMFSCFLSCYRNQATERRQSKSVLASGNKRINSKNLQRVIPSGINRPVQSKSDFNFGSENSSRSQIDSFPENSHNIFDADNFAHENFQKKA